ncbi:MAG: hypothetical protein JOZ78_16755 [Chroococcidiopsidaceae cyanobacterium CP_BM_ER_R8_30]|nr:hypothetical protein [Chroococcidiopsidaceae cyanobacterium CP_BM_ER_R8_30]
MMPSVFTAISDSVYGTAANEIFHGAKGYYQDGDYTFWEPTDPTDLEPETCNHGPGAMKLGEIDDYDGSDCEEF